MHPASSTARIKICIREINLLRSGLPGLSVISLQPRYRRLLTVGALLDESISLYRAHWVTFALFSLIALVPAWAVSLTFYVGGFQRLALRPATAIPPPEYWFALFGLTLVQSLMGALWSAAATIAAAKYLGGEEPSVGGAYGRALRRLPLLILTTLLLALLWLFLFLASTVLFVVTLFGTLGTLVALIALINWWVKPESRRTWLKWLIILTSPFGLVTYYFVRWSLYLPAVVLEGEGPIGALARSSRLVQGQWFRAGAVLTLASLILIVLVSVPVLIVSLVIGLAGVASGFGNPESSSVVTQSVTFVVQILFSSVGFITYLLLFVDLRNRREGTDLSERISSLEATSV